MNFTWKPGQENYLDKIWMRSKVTLAGVIRPDFHLDLILNCGVALVFTWFSWVIFQADRYHPSSPGFSS